MKDTDRTIEDVLREERILQHRLENLEQDRHRFVRFEEETDNTFGENLSQLRELENLPLSSQEREALDTIILSYEHSRRFVASDMDDYQEDLKKREDKLVDQLEALYLERQELYRKEERRKKGIIPW